MSQSNELNDKVNLQDIEKEGAEKLYLIWRTTCFFESRKDANERLHRF